MTKVATPTANAPDKGTKLGQLSPVAIVLSCPDARLLVNLSLRANSWLMTAPTMALRVCPPMTFLGCERGASGVA